MRTFGFQSAPWRLSLLLCLLLQLVTAANERPSVKRTQFSNQPSEILYFDDSQTVLVTDQVAGSVYMSTDEGITWNVVPELDRAEIIRVYMNPFHNQVAVALGADKKHWITRDRGQKWRSFSTDLQPALMGVPLSFHATDPDRVIVNMRDWREGETIYTTNGFETQHVLREKTIRCLWAKEQDLLSTGSTTSDRDRTLCIVEGKYSEKQEAWRLLQSDDFFESEKEPELEDGRSVTGIANIVAVKGYVLAARNTAGTDEMALYVTNSTNEWHRAQFGQHKLKEGGYTIMESTNYSLQVDVVSSESRDIAPVGMLFTSNSAGQYFTRNEDYTNRNRMGFVDFEKISSIQGIVLTNIVTNWEAVRDTGAEKRINSKISFDDGRTFHDIKNAEAHLHLHSITEQTNAGRVFSSPAPGLVMGIGNTGESLHDIHSGDLYVSSDAGLTWDRTLPGPHKYEFGDQGSVLLAIYDEGEIAEMIYSLNHGKLWTKFYFADYGFPEVVRPQMLTTIPDSTSLKFVLMATTGRIPDLKHWVYTIDFAALALKQCSDSDFETWYARKDETGKASCIMGHTQSFRRRKAEANCVVGVEFKDPLPIEDSSDCLCQERDYECDFGFARNEDRTQCNPIGRLTPPEGECKDSSDTFRGPSGFRLIPGNTCKKSGGVEKSDTVVRPCSSAAKMPGNGKITSEVTKFPADDFREYFYLERTATGTGEDETVVLLTSARQVYISADHGKTWQPTLRDTEVVAIYPNKHFSDMVYFITPSRTVHYSKNRGKDIHSFDAPGRPNSARIQILRFHPKNPDWLIWTMCAEDNTLQCQPVAQITTKNGDGWTSLMRSIENCEFVWREGRAVGEKAIYCTHYTNEDTTGPKELVSSEDMFETKTTLFKDMLNFATMSEFIVVAAKDTDDSKFLKVDASIDGKTFADAKFPANLKVLHQTAYTVLDSSTHSIFLHVTVNNLMEQEYGSIIKSNSNGTSYALSINGVNRNSLGYVDFEKLMGLEGVAVANIVSNIDDVTQGSAKKLKTMITHNDGAEWSFIEPPVVDAEGTRYECVGQSLNECSLHLHGYTERKDPRDTYSSASAVGLMMGIGNVGQYLGRKKDGNTFVSRDGGVTWHTAKNGQYMWEYGDQGSLIVIVEETTPTNVVYYSRDEGQTWKEYEFSETKLSVDDITTVPSDTSRNFLLWGRETTGTAQVATVNIDFTGLTDKRCNIEQPGTANSDYELWSPKHPLQETDCLFGHVSQYYRKKTGSNCYNGQLYDKLYQIERNCTCTRRDYEWYVFLSPPTYPVNPLPHPTTHTDPPPQRIQLRTPKRWHLRPRPGPKPARRPRSRVRRESQSSRVPRQHRLPQNPPHDLRRRHRTRRRNAAVPGPRKRVQGYPQGHWRLGDLLRSRYTSWCRGRVGLVGLEAHGWPLRSYTVGRS